MSGSGDSRMQRIAVCGGVYSNPYALRAFVADARARGAGRLWCLGDLGGYGAEPEEIWQLLLDSGIECIAGNYEVAIGRGDPGELVRMVQGAVRTVRTDRRLGGGLRQTRDHVVVA